MKRKSLLFKMLFAFMLLLGFGSVNMMAQTLKHSYTFDGNANDAVGNVNGTVSGGVFENGTYIMFNGDEYIEFDAAALALNTYEAITVETYVKRGTNGDNEYNAVWSFNGYRGGNDYLLSIVRGSNSCQTEVNGMGVAGPEPLNDEIHHYVSILTKESLSLYIDGVLVNKKATSGDMISTIGAHPEYPATAFIGKSTWPDASFKGTLYEWNIYEGVLDDATIYDNAKDFGVVSNSALLESLTITNGSLYPAFNPSTTDYVAILDPGTTTMNVTGVAFEAEAGVIGNADVAIDSETGSYTVTVLNGDDLTEYTIKYMVDTELTLKHSYDFNEAFLATDVVGGVNGETSDFTNIFDGAWHADGTNANKIVLDPEQIAINTYPSITFEGHVTLGENPGYTILYYFGGDGNNNATLLRLTDGSGASESWAQISSADNNVTHVATPEPDAFTEHHYVVVVTYGSIKYYLDGYLVGESQITSPDNFISNIGTDVAYLGVGTWNDPLLKADVDEFNIYSGEMDAATVKTRAEAYGIATAIRPEKANNTKVYPTISSGDYTVEFTGKPGLISVYNLAGNLVKKVQPAAAKGSFSIDQPGMYIVKVQGEGGMKTFKVIKK
ncbi:LamG-like jellyroll fold domain-containing protein [Carboxylicivirga caseinilyticus]|uniref:LamG-like jellyroll fold domain-containing protein n=1 Tax=Carboxylicivirga caseinilyticus TaxID=3417572 RepID=UPI003D324F98|nr:T9SS type A sorting domain-containing protein [Marinilabiliaceae bacterium A049]